MPVNPGSFFPQELQFRVLDDLDVSRKGRPPLKYILSRTMGFGGSGSFFFCSVLGLDTVRPRFLSAVSPRSPGTLGFQSPASFFRELRTRSVHGLSTVRPRFVRAHLAPLALTFSLYLQIQ